MLTGVPVSNQFGWRSVPGVPKLLRCELHDGRWRDAEGETAFWEPMKWRTSSITSARCRAAKNVAQQHPLCSAICPLGKRETVISVVKGDGYDNHADSILLNLADFRIDKLVVRLISEAMEMDVSGGDPARCFACSQ